MKRETVRDLLVKKTPIEWEYEMGRRSVYNKERGVYEKVEGMQKTISREALDKRRVEINERVEEQLKWYYRVQAVVYEMITEAMDRGAFDGGYNSELDFYGQDMLDIVDFCRDRLEKELVDDIFDIPRKVASSLIFSNSQQYGKL